MNTFYNQTIFEILPDEILLEVCKYLLCSDILYSFMGLNSRLTQTITHYRYHLTFHKTSITKFDYISLNIIPQIGHQIRSLVIDCCYSIIQHPLFIQYFGEKMSIIFPNLQRINLVSYQPDQLQDLLNTLHNLNSLIEIRLYSLFPIEISQQSTLVQLLFQANNHRLTTIFLDDYSSCLTFNSTDCYLNILELRIRIKTVNDLPLLFSAIPNIQYLDIVISERDQIFEDLNKLQLSPLSNLIKFQLKSIGHAWTLEEVITLLIQLPIIQCLSLFLFTDDKSLILGDIILSLLPSTVQQFNYAIYYSSSIPIDNDDTIVSSWPSSHLIACIYDENFLFIHTIPWHFSRIDDLPLARKMIASQKNNTNGYDRHIEKLDIKIDKNVLLSSSLTILTQCRRVRELTIGVKEHEDIEKQVSISTIPKLSRLLYIWLYGLVPSDLTFFPIILQAAPNLSRLDLSFEHLLKLLEDQKICQLLDQRITSLAIFENEPNSSSITLKEEHISIIASSFSRIRDIYVNFMHLPCSTTLISKEDSSLQNIMPLSSESMLVCLLTKFQEHKLIGVCIDAQFIEEIKTNTENWLRANTVLGEQRFYAFLNNESNRLLIWM